jgi:hypothetical protein
VEDAAAEEGVGQLLLVVAGDDHDRPLLGDDLVAGLGDAEAHAIELVEQVVRELEVGLVDLVDEQHHALVGRKASPERPELDVPADVLHVAVAEARVVEALHRVVDVEAVLRARRALDVPGDELGASRLGDGLGEQRLARAGLALHQRSGRSRASAQLTAALERVVGEVADRCRGSGGNEGSDTVVRSGDEARWFKVHIQEADSGISEADLSYRVTLASPPGMNYDLRVYQGSQDGPANCNGTLKVGAGTPETVSDSWDDDQGFGGEDDSVWLVIEVVYVSGDLCGVDNQWTLTVAGNT